MNDEMAKTINCLEDFVRYTKKGVESYKLNDEFELFSDAYKVKQSRNLNRTTVSTASGAKAFHKNNLSLGAMN